MLKSNKSRLRWIGVIVIGVILFGMQVFVGDKVWAQDQDLVFTPVTPCRIHDSRYKDENDEPCEVCGEFSPGNRREYYVYGGEDRIFERQGGNEKGCPAPQGKGEPAAVHLNVTAVPQSGGGNFGVFPANEGPPNASLVNYKAGVQNIANAATIKTYFQAGAREIEVINRFGSSHLVIDVMGYFYPAP